MKFITLTIWSIFIILNKSDKRIPIITINVGSNHKGYTTGNGNLEKVVFENLHLQYKNPNEIQNFHQQEQKIKYYNNIKDQIIIDFANEDPKVFSPEKYDYYYIASKRGFLFNFIGVLFMCFIFWIFVLRLAYGECGGYKYMIRKYSKSDRYQVHMISFVGVLIFMLGFGIINYYMVYDKNDSSRLGTSLVQRNKDQLKILQNKKSHRFQKGVYNKLKEINKMKMDTIYSIMSYEPFKVSNSVQKLLPAYEMSLKNATDFNDNFFVGMKSQIYTRTLIIILGVMFILFSYFYAYKKRKVIVSLILTLVIFFFLILSFNTLATIFNVWTISLEICDQTLKLFQPQFGDVWTQRNQKFNKILTCLDPKEKKVLKNQMLSLLIGQNTIINIMKNYLSTNVKEKIEILDTAESINTNYQQLLNIFKESSKQTNFSFNQLQNFLQTFKTMNELYLQLEKLDRCQEMKKWAIEANLSLCTNDVSYQYYIMWGFFIMIIGIFVIACGIYLGENVIRALYNEEIQYVKTNKLRFDWN